MIGKNKTRWLAFLLSVATVINLLPLTIGATNKVTAAESYPSDSSTTTDTITGTDNGDGTWRGSYLSYNEESGKLEQMTTTATIVTGFGGTGHTLTSGWYVALNRLSYPKPLKISGDVHLILADGASVYTNGDSCIDLTEGNSLTIYAQSKPKYKDDGSLDTEKTTTGRLYTGNAYGTEFGISGIGACHNSDSRICGTLTINGGIIEAAGSENAPGIGGGVSVGKITINGGYVDVKGNGAPAIGDGWVSGEYLTINGGTLIADSRTYSQSAHGIGASTSPSFPVTINGFDFIRLSGSSSAFAEAPTINGDFNFHISVGDDLDHLTDLENSDVTSSIYTEYCAIEMIPCLTHVSLYECNDSETHTTTCKLCGKVEYDEPHEFDASSGLCACGLWKGEYLDFDSETMSYKKELTTATVLTGDETVLDDGIYVAIGEVEICSSTFEMNSSSIILADGAKLRIKGPDGSPTQINVNAVNIFAQSHPLYSKGGVVDENKNRAGAMIIDGCISGFAININGGIVSLGGSSAQIDVHHIDMYGGLLDVAGNNPSGVIDIDASIGVYAPSFIKARNLNETKTAAIVGSVEIDESLKVCVTGDDGCILPDEFGSVFSSHSSVMIEPCTDETHTADTDQDTSDSHALTCKWCGSTFASHDFDKESGLCTCGLWHGIYLEYNHKTKKYDTKTATAKVLTGRETVLTEGWYVAVGEINSNIASISGDVHIILTDDSCLSTDPIEMEANSNLRIYGQSTPIFDEYGDIDESKNKAGTLDIFGGDQEALKGYYCTLTVDGGVVRIEAYEYIAINIGSVTLNGGYLEVYGGSSHYTNTAIAANVTINGGRLFANGSKYGVNGQVTINDFDRIEIMGNIQAITGSVYILDGLRVRTAMLDDDGNPTYIPLKDFGSDATHSEKWLTFEPCTDETHSLVLKYKDANTHTESCDWCGLDQDVAHDFDEKTSICECGVWKGSYLEYNSTTKKFETKTTVATVIVGNESKLTEGWYVVVGDVSITPARLEISGNVNIILADESNFDVENGITINNYSHLHIYAQSEPVYNENHEPDDSKSKSGRMSIYTGYYLTAVIMSTSAYSYYDCYLTIDGGYVQVEASPYEKGVILNGVTINGGYFNSHSGPELDCIVANKFTINGGVIFIAGPNGILADVEINGLDYICVSCDYRAFGKDVTIAEGLHVRMQSLELDGSDEYIAYEDQADLLESYTTIELCTNETHKMNESKTPTCKDENVHTAICEWCGATYDAVHEYDKDTGKCICGKDGISTSVIGYTLTLDGKIGVNFYMELSDEIASSATAYMHFILPDGSTCDVPVSDAKERIIDGKTYYVFSCYVAAYEMTSDIYAQIKEGELSGTLYDFTIREYAEYIISNPSDYTDGDVAFAKALLNYGAAAQTYFEVEADDLANKNLSNTDKAITELTAEDLASFAKEPISKEGVGSFIGFNLALGSETSLRAYFELWDGVNIGNVVFKVNGVIVKAERVGDCYRIAANNIKAFDLDEDVTFTAAVGDEVLTFECSAMSYCHSVLVMETCEDYPATLKTLISAIRAYQLASEIYNK